MKSLHRAVVGGGIGVLAMAGVASSVAFACTAQARVTGAGGVTTIVAAPGDTVTIEASGFAVDTPGNEVQYSGYSNPTFTWNDVNGPLLAGAVEPTWVVQSSGTARATWTVQVQIPADATPREKPYGIVGSQTNSKGTLYTTGMLPVFIDGEIPAPVAPQTEPANLDGPPAPIVTPSGDSSTPGTPQATPSAPASAPAASRPAATGPVAPQAPAATPSAGSATPSSALGTPAPATPAAAVPAGAPATPVDPTRPVPVPAANELWSGLNSSTSASSLLDAPAPASSGSGSPAGAVLLGMGVLALAGTAAVATQRRLAVAKAVRR